ncbi:hypothetical protein HPB47_017405 [Ixodes persulcatus]|uniref:Uncharacterized protein n=1 Tax=Ixodes persulcatus TaxID=34615 RepID=A0AC60QQR7_IXOPE|nr:hypothetical protein HPB47_017405 [Ixodes persulcatus]
MWKQFGVNVDRHSRVVDMTPHPQVPGEQIPFLADVPHLIKNLNGHLVRNGLTCSTVSLEPFRQLVEFQRNLTFKLAPKLRPVLLYPNHFDFEKRKMSKTFIGMSRSCLVVL